MKKENNFGRALFLQVGSTIGAGIFGLPYTVARAGWLPALIYLVFLSLAVLLINLAYTEVILSSRGDHQLTGYGQIYAGRKGLILATLTLMISSYGALLAYMIQMGSFAAFILQQPQRAFHFSLLFYALAALIVVGGLQRIAQIETLIVPLIIAAISFLAFFGLAQFSWQRIPLWSNKSVDLFLPYGVWLFALGGASIIPEVEEVLRREHFRLRRTILWGTLIPAGLYGFFAFVVAGISGLNTSSDGISGLAGHFPLFLLNIVALLGILTMFSSFLALAYVLKEMYFRDGHFPLLLAWVLTLSPPLLLFILGARSFIRILEISGGIIGGLTGVLVIWLYGIVRRQGRQHLVLRLPRSIIILLALIFFGGIVYELQQLFF